MSQPILRTEYQCFGGRRQSLTGIAENGESGGGVEYTWWNDRPDVPQNSISFEKRTLLAHDSAIFSKGDILKLEA